MITDSAPPPRKITLGFILGWLWFIFAGIGGLIALADGQGAFGFWAMLSGLCAWPLLWSYLRSKTNLEISGWLRLVGVIGFMIAAGVSAPKPREGESTGSSAAGPTSAPAPAPASAPAQQTTLLDIDGSGTKSTEKFTTHGDDWDLKWTYNCSNFGGRGNFQVMVKAGGDSFSSNGMVNQLGASGSDTEHYHTGGTFYLEVNSECTWHVTVTG